MFRAIGRPPSFSNIPVWIFDASINFLQGLADLFQNEQLENAAELGRIGKYYAVEDMVEETNRYGTISLQEHFDRIAADGQEYDPYTTMTGILGLLKNDDREEAENKSLQAGNANTVIVDMASSLTPMNGTSLVSDTPAVARSAEGVY